MLEARYRGVFFASLLEGALLGLCDGHGGMRRECSAPEGMYEKHQGESKFWKRKNTGPQRSCWEVEEEEEEEMNDDRKRAKYIVKVSKEHFQHCQRQEIR